MNSLHLHPGRRARTFALVPALIAMLLLAGTAGGAKIVPAQPERPPKADRNGDRIFDDLAARLAQLGPHDELGVIVTLTAPATADRVQALSQRVGGFVTSRRFTIVDAFAATVNKGQAEALAHAPWVAHVEEDSAVSALNDSAQSSFGVTKARLDVPSLDGDGDGNPAVSSARDLVAAVIDTGIDASHLDLDEGKVIGFRDFVNGRTSAYDDNGHGTHVAATIAGDGEARADRLYAGVAPAAALVGLKVLDANGSGTMSNVTAALQWAVDNRAAYGIEAVNLSLGASGCSDGTDATSQAVNAAAAAGLVVAVAAGNEGPGTCTVGSPGAASGALTVGAMADLGAGGFSLASFSSRGNTADGRVKPDVVAPGVGVTSAQAGTTTGYVAYDGTSMATPFVAGVALLALDANAALTPSQVRNALVSTAVDWGRPGADGEYGAGRLDAYAALAAAGAPLTAPSASPPYAFAQGSLSATGAYVDFSVHVSDVRFPLATTLILTGLSAPSAYNPDFDLYLYDPTGRLVDAAETVDRQENVTFRPTATGTYTLRVASYSGSGAYQVDVSGGSLAVAPTPAPTPTTTVTASPSSGVIQAGSLRAGDLSRLTADDDAYLEFNSTLYATYQTSWYGTFSGVANSLRSLSVRFRGKATRSCTQTIWIWRWTDGVWVQLDSRTAGATETEVNAVPGGAYADYVSGATGNGDVRVRIRCATGYGTFVSSADLLQITYEK